MIFISKSFTTRLNKLKSLTNMIKLIFLLIDTIYCYYYSSSPISTYLSSMNNGGYVVNSRGLGSSTTIVNGHNHDGTTILNNDHGHTGTTILNNDHGHTGTTIVNTGKHHHHHHHHSSPTVTHFDIHHENSSYSDSGDSSWDNEHNHGHGHSVYFTH
ncbi:hypothetical protein NAPIS_ORF02725 [Vairimorpha apis BRL 01]|uniref:Uncharacterized protein n=1 Tax=Vairimorpha apis BRL 01 TaxID=1037528 RepID=T0L4M9_9MICR|nr:hypothetical protein NAPIS_ORF02725 [Vairimorpha apis BRL 01]